MRRSLRGILAAAWLAAAATPLSGQTVDFGVGTLRFTSRVQTQFSTTNIDESDIERPGVAAREVAATAFESRRVRLGVAIQIWDWITGHLEPDFAGGRVQLRDAYMNFGLHDAFELRAGQFKKPFSLLFLTSSARIIPIERGARIRGLDEMLRADAERRGHDRLTELGGVLLLGEEQQLLEGLGYLGYDVGAMAHGRVGRVRYMVGAFNGTGPDTRDDNDAKTFAGRLEYRPSASLPLALAAGVSRRDVLFPVAPRRTRRGTAYEADVEWGAFRRPGFRLQAEAAMGENLAVDERFVAAQLIAAVYRPIAGSRIEGIEPVARVSWGDPSRDRPGDEGLLLTPGLNLYLTGLNRLMVNWDVYAPRGSGLKTAHAFRAQAQLAF